MTAVGVMVTLTLVVWTGGVWGTPLETWSCDYRGCDSCRGDGHYDIGGVDRRGRGNTLGNLELLLLRM